MRENISRQSSVTNTKFEKSERKSLDKAANATNCLTTKKNIGNLFNNVEDITRAINNLNNLVNAMGNVENHQ